MKYLLVSFFLLSVMLVECLAEDQVIGAIAPTDSLLAQEKIKRPFRLGRVTDYDYTYTGAATVVITGIRITDYKSFTSPPVTITGGALGTNTITLRFTSQRSKGIKSLVEVYGTT